MRCSLLQVSGSGATQLSDRESFAGAPQYKVISMTGTPNNPTFTMTCTVQDKTFSGSGRSKKEAKLSASQLVLQEMFGKDFSGGGETEQTQTERRERERPAGQEIKDWLELEGKNPVSILNELYPGVIFTLVSAEGPSHAPVYRVRASLASLTYEGTGASKKEAKLHASKALLAEIHRVGFDPVTGGLKSPEERNNNSKEEESHSWADRVGRLVREQYDRLCDGTTFYKRKVLAGVVLDIAGQSSVICVSTGTKCINGEMMSLNGQSLNDCHAEVVVRRSLVFWLYSQLEEAMTGLSDVLQQDQTGGFCLRRGVTLHLFISTAPCGDARIFSLHEQPAEGSNVLTGAPGRLGEGNRGKLRTKIESGMGTVPLAERETLQTWDGVMSGERLVTMACSDKILGWNVTGLQGSLLSHWLSPVYFSTVSIGSKFHPCHVNRAVHGRVAGQLELAGGYRLNRPPVLATTSPETRQPSKAQDHSLNWVVGRQPEVVTASTGRSSQGDRSCSSRLCKRALADSFVRLCSLPSGLHSARTELSNFSLQQICSMRWDTSHCACHYNLSQVRRGQVPGQRPPGSQAEAEREARGRGLRQVGGEACGAGPVLDGTPLGRSRHSNDQIKTARLLSRNITNTICLSQRVFT